jgi:hypothetical protein
MEINLNFHHFINYPYLNQYSKNFSFLFENLHFSFKSHFLQFNFANLKFLQLYQFNYFIQMI